MAQSFELYVVQTVGGGYVCHKSSRMPGLALVDAATQNGCGTLLISRAADQGDDHERALRRAGLAPARTETTWRLPAGAIPTAPARTTPDRVSGRTRA